jgi:WD repeat-containing protein 22
VIVHEVETRQPLDYFLHEEPVYGISVHPLNPDLFVTACSDGRLLLYDMRQVNISNVKPTFFQDRLLSFSS